MNSNYKVRFLIFFLVSSINFAFISPANSAGIKTKFSRKTEQAIMSKGFYLLHVLNSTPEVKNILMKDPVLSGLSWQKAAKVNSAVNTCSDMSCISQTLMWTGQEIKAIGDQLLLLRDRYPQFREVMQQLRKEGKYKLFEKGNEDSLLRNAWEQDAAGINNVLATYMEGKAPRYPKIDAISYNVDDLEFKSAIRKSVKKLFRKHQKLFFELPAYAALSSLAINGRDEAARYEPMWKGDNKAPFKQIANTEWDKYKYSVILVPGQGPEEQGVALEPNGAYRCRLAAERFKNGLAPFIVVSGGNVHPNKTPFNEAVEMKKYMVDSLHLPAKAIFIEPHARHTTTNLRNVNRMIYHFGIPEGKPVMTVTDASQSKYILGMDKRNAAELGNTPYTRMTRLSDLENEYYPSEKCLHINPLDILDP
ncbi:MAG: YdcF family protein [Sphingobacteriaceae bacterium]|jgi:hypothetical protein|nr:YdcF family protein [Sphingobacteriaceae bacterium]